MLLLKKISSSELHCRPSICPSASRLLYRSDRIARPGHGHRLGVDPFPTYPLISFRLFGCTATDHSSHSHQFKTCRRPIHIHRHRGGLLRQRREAGLCFFPVHFCIWRHGCFPRHHRRHDTPRPVYILSLHRQHRRWLRSFLTHRHRSSIHLGLLSAPLIAQRHASFIYRVRLRSLSNDCHPPGRRLSRPQSST